jgi:Tfp pilus assembly protein PilO
VITSRDRKIILCLVPILVLMGYWFLVLAPKRQQAQKVTTQLTDAQEKRDTAQQQVAQLSAAKASFASDYATVISLGKAVPTTVDMPSLLVQIDEAARGTGITISDFKPGDAASSGDAGAGASTGAGTPPGGGANPAAPGSPPAQTMPGKQAQKAGNAVTQANGSTQAAAGSQGGAGGSSGAPTPSAPGLTSVPLSFTISGSFFNLADFFHQMKRFVRVVNDRVVVRGRLLTIEGFSFQRQDDATGKATSALKADVNATVYLTPADQGVNAGATSGGPAPAGQPAASPQGSTPSTPTPTAAATP